MNGVQHTISRSTYPEGRNPPAGNDYQREWEETIRFKLKDSSLEKQRKREKAIDTGKGNSGSQKKTVSLTFDPPVTPQTFMIGLRPVENRVSPVFTYWGHGVPLGRNGQFLGFGRLHLYSDGGDTSWFSS